MLLACPTSRVSVGAGLWNFVWRLSPGTDCPLRHCLWWDVVGTSAGSFNSAFGRLMPIRVLIDDVQFLGPPEPSALLALGL